MQYGDRYLVTGSTGCHQTNNGQHIVEIDCSCTQCGQWIEGLTVETVLIENRNQTNHIAELEAENERLKAMLDNWSYCAHTGMMHHCPEEKDNFIKDFGGLGIHPYSAKLDQQAAEAE